MIEINLLPEELRRKESLKIALPDIPIKKTLLVAGAALLSLQLFLMLAALYVKIENASLTRQVSILRRDNHDILRQKAEIEGMRNRMSEIRGLTARPFRWASLLDALTQSATKGVWLDRMSIVEKESRPPKPVKDPKEKKSKKAARSKGEKEKPAAPTIEKYLVLDGAAIGAGQETAFIGKFLKELKANPLLAELFSDIKASNIHQRRFGEYEVYGFTISCRFKKEKMP